MSYRIQHKFWLDIERDSEAALNDEVVYLKQQRSFASTIRDGLRLIADLRAGRTDVLLELFPFVRAELSDGGAGGSDEKTAQIQHQLAELERLLLSQNNGALMAPVASNGGPKPMEMSKVIEPVMDDDEMPTLTVVKAKADSISAQNFLDQCFDFVSQ